MHYRVTLGANDVLASNLCLNQAIELAQEFFASIEEFDGFRWLPLEGEPCTKSSRSTKVVLNSKQPSKTCNKLEGTQQHCY
jgi:hypothetical protein